MLQTCLHSERLADQNAEETPASFANYCVGMLDMASRTLRASLSGTYLQRKDVVNQCLEFGRAAGSCLGCVCGLAGAWPQGQVMRKWDPSPHMGLGAQTFGPGPVAGHSRPGPARPHSLPWRLGGHLWAKWRPLSTLKLHG